MENKTSTPAIITAILVLEGTLIYRAEHIGQ
jgi:hypothetical protein